MNKILNIIIIGCLITAAYWYFSSPSNTTKPNAFGGGDRAIAVETLDISLEPFFDSIEILGNTLANESVDITANVSESISSITFTDGQIIEKGTVIALLEQNEEQAQLKSAELELKGHQRELKRIKTLLKNKAASQRDFDERLTQVQVTEQTIEEIKARVSDRTITAPFNGIVGIRMVSVGALVRPGDIITTIDDTSLIKLDFHIPSVYLPQVKPGIRIEAQSDALNGRVFEGVVQTVDSRVDPLTRTILVRAILPNEDHALKAGLLMRITLVKNKRQAILIPEEATTQEQNRFYVLTVDKDNSVSKRIVEIGTRKPGIVEITQGLEKDETIVVRGIHKVRPGQKANITKRWDSVRPNRNGKQGDI